MRSLTAIGHAELDICNPVGTARLHDVIEMLALDEGDRVLDVGCGKGDLLIRVATTWGCAGLGVDRDADLIEEGRARVETDAPDERIELIVDDAHAFLAARADERFGAACALGAGHIFGGAAATLAALAARVRPGGVVLIGEGFWARTPAAEYLAAIEGTPDELPYLPDLIAAGAAAGLEPIAVSVATDDEWDAYEWAHFRNVRAYCRARPDDAEAQAMLAQRRAWIDAYVRWRGTMGFALLLFQRA